LRQIARRARRGRVHCLRRYGRTPGRVSTLDAVASAPHTIVLTFRAAGTDRTKPPAAHSYVIKQSTQPIRTPRDFHAAHALCHGTCSFAVTSLGATIRQKVTGLDRRRVYYYSIAARDNVSARVGPRSRTVTARTR